MLLLAQAPTHDHNLSSWNPHRVGQEAGLSLFFFTWTYSTSKIHLYTFIIIIYLIFSPWNERSKDGLCYSCQSVNKKTCSVYLNMIKYDYVKLCKYLSIGIAGSSTKHTWLTWPNAGDWLDRLDPSARTPGGIKGGLPQSSRAVKHMSEIFWNTVSICFKWAVVVIKQLRKPPYLENHSTPHFFHLFTSTSCD